MEKIFKIAFLISTAGSVARYAVKHSLALKNATSLVISDRQCDGLQLASQADCKAIIIPESDNIAFSSKLLDVLVENEIDLVVSFFTRLLTKEVITPFKGHLINFHPSLLPSFKGQKGFEEGCNNSVPVIGSTVHYIDESMDGGAIIQQTFAVKKAYPDKVKLRHCIFEQQLNSLVQVIEWITDNRISIHEGHVHVENAQYDMGEFFPNIEFSKIFIE